MINRRNFLKLSGLGAIALSSGFGAGKLFNHSSRNNFAVYGFLPDDDAILSETIKLFDRRVSNYSSVELKGDKQKKNLAEKILNPINDIGNNNVVIRLEKIIQSINSDIILSDNNISVYDPHNDFDNSFLELRTLLQNKKADYFFSTEVKHSDLLNKLFFDNEKFLIIENEKGLFDKISLDKNYDQILIDGPQGKTGLKIKDGLVTVNKPTCRHKICQKMFASNKDDLIACAPNKVLIKIV